MTLAKRGSHGLSRTRSLLNNLLELPHFAETIQALPAHTFAALLHQVGVENAGELVAVATTEQLVQAFDEDLFVSKRAGERESFELGRFIVWLEVLLEAGEEATADRIAELDEDFVAHALGSMLLVFEEDVLRACLNGGDEEEARQLDKSFENALTEEVEGYILVAKQHEGWDAVLALVLALDCNHRALLIRLLERLSRMGSAYLNDFGELSTVLSEGELLAEDAEAAREERRSKQGYVEAQAAAAFLSLARKPLAGEERDFLTRAYFREAERRPSPAMPAPAAYAATPPLPPSALQALGILGAGGGRPTLGGAAAKTSIGVFTEALRKLRREEPLLFGERMEEFAYLANVLVAAHQREGSRLCLKEAAEAAMATVCYGAMLELGGCPKRNALPSAPEFAGVLRRRGADILFRMASSALVAGAAPQVKSARKAGVLYSAKELEAAVC